MKNKLFSILLLSAMIFFGGIVLNGKTSGKEIKERKIVVFEENFVNESAQDELISKTGGVKVKSLKLVNSAVLLGDPASVKALKDKKGIKRIDDDIEVYALVDFDFQAKVNKKASSPQSPQSLPWGIDRVDAEKIFSFNSGTSAKLGIIDTGIDLFHPDLQANIKGGVNTINPLKNANDDNGHGTHVAGTAAAINNSIGVVGVGPEINLYAIKVLNRNGSGFLSDVIEGIQWAIANDMDVVNMSLGTSSNIQSFHDAVVAAKNAGIVVVAAAGNSGRTGGTVSYPAAYPEAMAVSATDSSDNLASFSSRGPEVDIAAPGVSVYSTYKGSSYATFSGTSMASPHVAGAAALVIKTPIGIYDSNLNGLWDPAEVKSKLEATATDLGVGGRDNLFGAGLLNAFLAGQ